MKKVRFFTLLVLVLATANSAFADCRDVYDQAFKAAVLNGKISREATVTGAAQTGATAGILVAAGAFGIGGIAFAAGSTIVMGAEHLYRKHKIHEIKNTRDLIRQAYEGHGERIDKMVRGITKHHVNADTTSVSTLIVSLSENNALCAQDEIGRFHLVSEKHITQYAIHDAGTLK